MLQKNESREEGFTLIELLVVILIIGILSAIAIPAFLNQRKSAVGASVKSDVANTAKVVETWVSKQGSTKKDLDAAARNFISPKLTSGTTMQVSGTSQRYFVIALNPGMDEPYYVYDSAKGGFLKEFDGDVPDGNVLTFSNP